MRRRVGDAHHVRVKVLSTRRPYAIIGRNVLAGYVLRLHGPAQRLDLTTPGARVKSR